MFTEAPFFYSMSAGRTFVYIIHSLFSHFHPAETTKGTSVGHPRTFQGSFTVCLNISQSVFLYKGGSCWTGVGVQLRRVGLSQSSLSSDTDFHSKQYSCIALLQFKTMKLASNCRADVVNSLPSSWPAVPIISQFNTFLLSTGGREQPTEYICFLLSFCTILPAYSETAQMDHWPTEATERMILQGCFVLVRLQWMKKSINCDSDTAYKYRLYTFC